MQNNKHRAMIISAVIGLCMAVLISVARGAFSAGTTADRILAFCDGFSVSGVLLLCFGIMIWISNEGFFDVLSYAAQKGLHHLIPGRFSEDLGSFYDYKMSKANGKRAGSAFLVVPGIVILALGLILMGIWYSFSS